MDMLFIIYQAQLANISQFEFYLSIAGLALAILGYSRLMRKDRIEAMNKKVDVDKFDEFKIETNTKISHKASHDAFLKFEEQIWDELKQHESMNEVSFKLVKEEMNSSIKDLRKDLKENNDINVQLLNKMAELATDIKWIKQKI